jgi:hypothetical protein
VKINLYCLIKNKKVTLSELPFIIIYLNSLIYYVNVLVGVFIAVAVGDTVGAGVVDSLGAGVPPVA